MKGELTMRQRIIGSEEISTVLTNGGYISELEIYDRRILHDKAGEIIGSVRSDTIERLTVQGKIRKERGTAWSYYNRYYAA